MLQSVAYTTNCFACHINRKISFRFKTDHHVEPVSRVAIGVRIRKTIAQVDRHFAVVSMAHDCFAIAPLPTTHRACFELESHASLGKTAAPRGRMKPLPLPAWSNAAAMAGTGIIRICFT